MDRDEIGAAWLLKSGSWEYISGCEAVGRLKSVAKIVCGDEVDVVCVQLHVAIVPNDVLPRHLWQSGLSVDEPEKSAGYTAPICIWPESISNCYAARA